MLGQLLRYAEDEGLSAEPGFSSKRARWALSLGADGRYLGIVELGDPSAKRNPGRRFDRAPHLTQPEIKRGGKGCRHFLLDNAEVVTLLGAEDDEKVEAKHAYFVSLLRQASRALPVLEAAADRLSEPDTLERIRRDLEAVKARATENLTLMVAGHEPPFPVESDAWHAWWKEFRTRLAPERRDAAGAKMRCLATGELVQPAPTHPKVKRLSDVGGLSMGDVLASFKQGSFCSYGLVQSANAAVSEAAAKSYVEALNHILRTSSERLGSVRIAYWYRGAIEAEDDPLRDLLGDYGEGEEERAAALARARDRLRALRAGRRPELATSTYYVLSVSGAGGRVMVRDWIEGSFEELAEAATAWFEDLEIVRPDGAGTTPPPRFWLLPKVLVRDDADLPPTLVVRLWRAAVQRLPLPRALLAPAVLRVRSVVLRGERLQPQIFGLLKAFHLRQGDSPMAATLLEDHPSSAYQCGRLMAVLAGLQRRALGDVGAGVVERYYAAASTTPALVLGRLVRTSHFHLDKLERGLAHWYEGRIAEVMQRIGDRIPATLSLEEQSLFALGYYQQVAADRHRPSDATESPEPANEASADPS